MNFRDYIIHISQFYLWYFLLKELEEGYLDGTHGVFYQPMAQYADEAAAEEFDKQFPPMEKLKFPVNSCKTKVQSVKIKRINKSEFERVVDIKNRLIQEFNKLDIPDLGEIKELYEGKGSFVNLNFALPSGMSVRIWNDDKTYFINQIEKKGSDRCYGLTADENYLLVCEYG